MFSSSISSIFGKKDVSKEDLSVYYNNNNPNNEANAYNPNSPVTLRGTSTDNGSSFSFIGDAGNQDLNQPPSSFSFIAESVNVDENQDILNSDNTSGFEFLSAPGGIASDTLMHEESQQQYAPSTSNKSSSFNFLNEHQVDSQSSRSDLHNTMASKPLVAVSATTLNSIDVQLGLTQHEISSVLDVKLNRIASTKEVRKKKKTKRIGFGRDDDVDDTSSQGDTIISPQTELVPASEPYAVGQQQELPLSAPVEPTIQQLNFSKPPPPPVYVEAPAEQMVHGRSPSYHGIPSSLDPSTPPLHVAMPPMLNIAVVDYGQSQANQFDGPSEDPSSTIVSSYEDAEVKAMPMSTETLSVVIKEEAKTPSKSVGLTSQCEIFDLKSRQNLNDLVSLLADLSRIWTSALSGQKRFASEISTELAAINKLKTLVVAAEQQQANYALTEDFDSADAMNQVIETHHVEIGKKLSSLNELKVATKELEVTYNEERHQCISDFFNAIMALNSTKQSLEKAVCEMKIVTNSQIQNEADRISAELERVSLEKSNFEREEEALIADTTRIEELMRSQTVDLDKRKADLEVNINVVEIEIQALEEELRKKRSELGSYRDEWNKVTSKLHDSHKKYDRQLQRLADRRSTLFESKNECLTEELALLQERQDVADQERRETDKKQSLLLWVSTLDASVKVAEVFHSKMISKVNASPAAEPLIASMPSLQSLESEDQYILDASLQAATEALSSAQEEVVRIERQGEQVLSSIKLIFDQIPKLEADKKQHASNKRFKEAASVANEIKMLIARKELLDRELEEIEQRRLVVTDSIAALESDRDAALAAATDAQKAASMQRFESLSLRYKEIRLLMITLDKNKLISSSKNIDLEVISNSDFYEMMGSFLGAELSSITLEAQAIQDKYRLPQSLEQFVEEALRICIEEEIVDDNLDVEVRRTSVSPVVESTFEETPTKAVVQDSCADDNADIPSATDEAAVQYDDSSPERHSKSILEAKLIMEKLKLLNESLDVNTELENYDLAAEIFQEIEENNRNLEQILLELHCCREDIED